MIQRKYSADDMKSARQLAIENKEIISNEPTGREKIIESLKCPRTITIGRCNWGLHNVNFDNRKSL